MGSHRWRSSGMDTRPRLRGEYARRDDPVPDGAALTPAATDRLADLVPRDGISQLAAVLEEFRRRAKAGRKAPRELTIRIELDEESGEVLAIEIPRRYDKV